MAGSKAQGRHDDLGQANAIGDLTCETWLEDELRGASDGKKHLSIGGFNGKIIYELWVIDSWENLLYRWVKWVMFRTKG